MTMRGRLVTTVVLGLLVMMSARQHAQAQAPTFRAAADAVMVEVSVQMGTRPLTGLAIGDFELRDNGVPQKIVEVTYGTLPIDVTVALDISYSVSGEMLDRLRRAVGQLLRDLRPEDRLRLMMFNARVARVLDYTNDPAELDRAMQTVAAGGGTALHDAISLALVSSRAAGRRQLIMVFTDGNDISSTTSMPVLQRVVESTTATLTMVMPLAGTTVLSFGPAGTVPTSMPSATRITTSGRFGSLAALSGGSVVRFRANENLGTIFRRILDSFRSTYVLHFIPQGVDRGGFHELAVTVDRPKAIVTARRGYFGG